MKNLVSSYYEKDYDILDLNTDVYLISKKTYNNELGRRVVVSIVDNEEEKLFIKKSYIDCIKYYDESVIKHILEYSMSNEDVAKTIEDINNNPEKYEKKSFLYMELENHCYGELIDSCILDYDEEGRDFMESEIVLEAIKNLEEAFNVKDLFK